MDIVYLRGLEVEAVIGIYDWERNIRQRLVFDLEMGTDIRAAASSEDIGDALNYHAVSERIKAFAGAERFLLIETLAERCAALIMSEFNVRWLRLQLAKPTAVQNAREVGVVIERGERW